jgi:hypothetical protein
VLGRRENVIVADILGSIKVSMSPMTAVPTAEVRLVAICAFNMFADIALLGSVARVLMHHSLA